MASLDVKGASLYYEKSGSGPVCLFIPGANGEADLYKPLAEHLSHRFTVVRYDRRGFSRSLLRGEQDYPRRLQTDADDIKSLIEQLATPDEPAIIFGNSSGAIVALAALIACPTNLIRTVIAHEPPLVKLLPSTDEEAKWRGIFRQTYDIYRKSGVPPAMEYFSQQIATGEEAQALTQIRDPRNGGYKAQNTMYWFERELIDYTNADIDVDVLRKHRSQLISACGDVNRPQILFQPIAESLAKRLDIKVVKFPGPHVGYVFHPEEFAKALIAAVDGHGS